MQEISGDHKQYGDRKLFPQRVCATLSKPRIYCKMHANKNIYAVHRHELQLPSHKAQKTQDVGIYYS